ncbi:MAG: DUF2207 domain-containing protein [Lachnospiraceae bacterium]|nr:DUF2207 domain-containing protein [Lachnospiraceae bacterium]
MVEKQKLFEVLSIVDKVIKGLVVAVAIIGLFLMITSGSIAAGVMLFLSLAIILGVIAFLYYYFCMLTVYKVEKTPDGIKLYAYAKTYDFPIGYTIGGNEQNHVIAYEKTSLYLPKNKMFFVVDGVQFTNEDFRKIFL